MILLKKTPLPEGIKINQEQDYRSDPVFSIIKNDCHNKCYICEEKEPTSLQVDHRISQHRNEHLKYCWANLLLACYHCNHTKGSDFNHIIDCIQVDPEDFISLSISSYPKNRVLISIKKDSDEAKETAKLLEIVYNGDKTTILSAECDNLRSRVFSELVKLRQKIIEYEKEPDSVVKTGFRQSIMKMISRSSSFAAFKRNLIRLNSDYMLEFGEYLF